MAFVPVLPSHAVDPCSHFCAVGRQLMEQALSWAEESPEQVARGKEFSDHADKCRQCATCMQHLVLSHCLIGCPQAADCWERAHLFRDEQLRHEQPKGADPPG